MEGFAQAAELNDALAAAIDLRWVLSACQLDGLAHGADCMVHRLRSDSMAESVVSVADPDSKDRKYVGLENMDVAVEVQRDVPATDVGLPVLTVSSAVGLVHCAIVNRSPRRVETTLKISSGGRVTIFQQRFCGRGKCL